MRKWTKKQIGKFMYLCKDSLSMYNPLVMTKGYYLGESYKLLTPVGELEIKIAECAVFMRFNDVDKARERFDCNPFTGKYNLHFSSKDDPQIAAVTFMHDLDEIMIGDKILN